MESRMYWKMWGIRLQTDFKNFVIFLKTSIIYFKQSSTIGWIRAQEVKL